MIPRRRFLKNTLLAGSSLLAGAAGWAGTGRPVGKPPLTLLTTNDTHSRLDPFPADASRYAGMGGVARRQTLIQQFREKQSPLLVLDAGDMFQGTPYYNVFQGIPEMEAMSRLGYDAGTIGNHEFDNGVEGLAEALKHANFPLLSANLEATGTPLAGAWKPDLVRHIDSWKVGIFGLCVPLTGLVSPRFWDGITILDTLEVARAQSENLRARGCDLIICLSHLGLSPNNDPNDYQLANAAPEIDLIVGGHSHNFINNPIVVKHDHHAPTQITQQGWAGIRLGVIRVEPTLYSLNIQSTFTPVC